MRGAWVAMLAMVSVGTVASSVRGQATAPASPSAVAPPPAAASTTPVASASAAPAAPPSAATDESVPETGWELGARVGFALPLGDINGTLQGALPLWIDFGRRFSRQLTLGVYGRVAVMFPAGASGFILAGGGEGQYHLAQPILGLDPWLGAGIGYENETVSPPGASSQSAGGLEYFNVQAGLDYKRGFGPFAAFAMGSYSGEGSVHEWVTIGMRSTYDW